MIAGEELERPLWFAAAARSGRRFEGEQQAVGVT
jgi:hypothetical protein